MLVIPQAHGQEGTGPKLQQPAVQLLGHEVEPVEAARPTHCLGQKGLPQVEMSHTDCTIRRGRAVTYQGIQGD